jgi:hypothetical protein
MTVAFSITSFNRDSNSVSTSTYAMSYLGTLVCLKRPGPNQTCYMYKIHTEFQRLYIKMQTISLIIVKY